MKRTSAAGSSQARSTSKHDLFANRWHGNDLKQQTWRAHVAINQFTEVMRVADLGHMEARADVNENDVERESRRQGECEGRRLAIA